MESGGTVGLMGGRGGCTTYPTGLRPPHHPLPALVIFSYNGGRTADDFLAHIRASLAADKGFARVDALDALARAVVGAGGDAAAAVDSLKAAAGKLAGEAKEHGAIYVHLASKAADKAGRSGREAQGRGAGSGDGPVAGASARAADACPQDGPQSPANTTFLFFLQGSDFFAKEAARLERMLASGKVGPGKLVEIGKKLSVLGAFTEDEPAAAAA